MSGIVLNADVQVRLQHAITHQVLNRWVPLSETNPGHELEIGDHIIHDDWVGQVCPFPSPAIVFSGCYIVYAVDNRGKALSSLISRQFDVYQ